MEIDARNEVKEHVSQGCLTRTWLLVVVWRSTRVLIPLQEPQCLAKNALLWEAIEQNVLYLVFVYKSNLN